MYIIQKDEVFCRELFNTIKFTVLGVGTNTLLGIGGAVSAQLTPAFSRALWRTIFFLPMITARFWRWA